MFDYLDWRGDLSFEASPFCSIDMLIFATLAYCPMENLKGKASVGTLKALADTVYPADYAPENDIARQRRQLWQTAADSRRFQNVTLERFESHFDPASEKQFAAALFKADDQAGIVAFRGTDATLVGWKEDFNMAFETPIPAQTDAIAFLNDAAVAYRQLYVCGHSKGGNLAVYAAAHALPENRRKLAAIYSFDGPGLDDATAASAEYAEISSRIQSFVPESSIIGMLMDYHNEYTIVDSDGVSIWQHNPFLWHVKGAAFVTKPSLTLSGQYADRTLHDFLAACGPDERRVLVDTIFDLIGATGATKLREIPGGVIRNLPAVHAKFKSLSPETRAVLTKVLKTLAESSGGNIDLLLKREEKPEDGATPAQQA